MAAERKKEEKTIMKARRRPVEVEVYPWGQRDHDALHDSLGRDDDISVSVVAGLAGRGGKKSWHDAGAIYCGHSSIPGRTFIRATLSRVVSPVHVYDWIVMDKCGRLSVCGPNEFERDYEVMEE